MGCLRLPRNYFFQDFGNSNVRVVLFNSFISFSFELNLGSTSLRITWMVFLRDEGFGRAMVLEGLAALAPGGE